MARARAVAGSGVEVAETAEVVVVMVPAKAGLAVERPRWPRAKTSEHLDVRSREG